MSHSAKHFENLIQFTYPDTNLPPLWQVIYQEAIRGHHILFTPQDVLQFDEGQSFGSIFTPYQEQTINLVVLLASCADLSSMKATIAQASEPLRHSLFALYKSGLALWRAYVKEQLH